MKTKPNGVIVAVVLVGVAAACGRENEREAAEPTQVAEREDDVAGMEPSGQSASTAIAQSRCAREQRCDNIGDGKDYSSFSDCETTIQSDWREDLNARECPEGVDQEQLNECMTEIRNEDCGSPFDSLERVAACTQAQICND